MSCAIFPFVEIKLRVPIRFSFYGFGAFLLVRATIIAIFLKILAITP